MAALPSTVVVDCPRCSEPIDCALCVEEVADDERRGFHTLSAHVRDLGERMAQHYASAHG